MLKKFGEERASSLAALVAYYAFVSLFPLLPAFVSILGFVLEDNPPPRADVVDTALARIPVIGAELRGDVRPLTGSEIALAVGLAGAFWAGLGVTLALGRAFAEIWDTPRLEEPGGLALLSLGGWYIDHVIVDASAIYGTFANLIGLLTWCWLVSHLLLIAAEVNVVLRWHLWPRALTGELEPADELTAAPEARTPPRRRRIPLIHAVSDHADIKLTACT